MRSPHTATKSSPCSPQLQKAHAQQWRPNTARKKQKKIKNPKIYKELLTPNNKKTSQLKNGPMTLTHTSPKIYRWQISIMKIYFPSCHQENANQNNEYHYTSIRTAKIQNTDNIKCWHGATETLIHCCGECKWYKPFWKTVKLFLTKLNIPYNPAITLLGRKELKIYVHTKTLHTDVYNNFVHNCQNLGATKMSCRRWMGK